MRVRRLLLLLLHLARASRVAGVSLSTQYATMDSTAGAPPTSDSGRGREAVDDEYEDEDDINEPPLLFLPPIVEVRALGSAPSRAARAHSSVTTRQRACT